MLQLKFSNFLKQSDHLLVILRQCFETTAACLARRFLRAEAAKIAWRNWLREISCFETSFRRRFAFGFSKFEFEFLYDESDGYWSPSFHVVITVRSLNGFGRIFNTYFFTNFHFDFKVWNSVFGSTGPDSSLTFPLVKRQSRTKWISLIQLIEPIFWSNFSEVPSWNFQLNGGAANGWPDSIWPDSIWPDTHRKLINLICKHNLEALRCRSLLKGWKESCKGSCRGTGREDPKNSSIF